MDYTTIPLTRGASCIVSPEDADLAQHKWCLLNARNRYAVRSVGPRGQVHMVLMHRVILERQLGRVLQPHEHTDHINGDGLDNRRANLRPATAQQNQQNQKPLRRNNTSGYRGVTWARIHGWERWTARIWYDGHCHSLGYFTTAEAAHKAYEAAATEHFGEFKRQ